VVFEMFYKNPKFLRKYLELITDHTFILGDRIKHMTNKSVRDKVLSFLEFEEKKQGSTKIKLEASKKEIAERIGIPRTSFSRELSMLRDEGIIKYDRNSIEIL
ncbi:MAG: helix-turn-helix domain-containing protein, partial [Gallicola sp.]|nr:helix-turn-helix domain-containing protein [Gallicola sp.]